jgi:hypothetical protein
MQFGKAGFTLTGTQPPRATKQTLSEPEESTVTALKDPPAIKALTAGAQMNMPQPAVTRPLVPPAEPAPATATEAPAQPLPLPEVKNLPVASTPAALEQDRISQRATRQPLSPPDKRTSATLPKPAKQALPKSAMSLINSAGFTLVQPSSYTSLFASYAVNETANPVIPVVSAGNAREPKPAYLTKESATGRPSPIVKVVKRGDYFCALAHRIYGFCNKEVVSLAQQINPQIIDMNLIYPGDEIVFPDLENYLNAQIDHPWGVKHTK